MNKTVKKSIIPISEIFGPTIQGEGMIIGRKTMFVRTSGCDYSCSWCDSAFTWNGTEKATILEPGKVLEELRTLGKDNFDHVTITGGNPALIGQGMQDLIHLLHEDGISVGVETQGSKYQEWFLSVDDMVLSPKPPSSKMKPDLETLDEIVNKVSQEGRKLSLKVVVFDQEDYDFAKFLHDRYPSIEFYLSVGNIEPYSEDDGIDHILKGLRWLCDRVIQDPSMNDVRVLPQLHTLIWGNQRKV